MPFSETARNIAFMAQPHTSPEEAVLRRDVAAELERRGFHMVGQKESDFTLACRVEKNWRTITRTVYPAGSYNLQPAPLVSPSGSVRYERPYQPFPSEGPYEIEDHFALWGIRLQFYPTSSLRAGHFETLWEGYIEAGMQFRPEAQRELVQILMDYYGCDFSGRAKARK
jgi:hypothetical protein